MFIAMEGPKPEDTDCSAVIYQACTKFCSMCKRQNFVVGKCRTVVCFLNAVSMCVFVSCLVNGSTHFFFFFKTLH